MSNFIVPLSNLPTISSITDVKGRPGTGGEALTDLPFADVLQNALQNVAGTGEVSQGNMYSLAMGGTDDLHTGAVDAVKYATAVSFASSLTSSAIRAYNQLMQMQV
ncbi:MAG: flagellar hook-basal body complex protein FliE [Oscillospiraceae bacterium]